IERIEPGASHAIQPVDLALSAGYLGSLRERVSGALHVEVVEADRCLLKERHPIDVLSFDEWPGLRSLPEILAAFIFPNHPVVEEILPEAASILSVWEDGLCLSGYQTGKRSDVYHAVAAIYAALAQRKLHYVSPPASFEMSGQKVRTPARIAETSLGTCLD